MSNYTNLASCFQVQCFLSKLSDVEAKASAVSQHKILSVPSVFAESCWESELAHSVATSADHFSILLTGLNVVTRDCLEDVKAIAYEEALTLEEALILTGWVTRKQLNDVCTLADMLESHEIDWATATAAMSFLASTNQTVSEAVERVLRRRTLRNKTQSDIRLQKLSSSV